MKTKIIKSVVALLLTVTMTVTGFSVDTALHIVNANEKVTNQTENNSEVTAKR